MKVSIKKLEKSIPKLTGVYLFKDAEDTFIYIGKAKNLHHRVNSYFQKYNTDWKIKQLIDGYADIDYILTPTETESLLLEAELVQKYKPKFNVLLKEGQPFLYILYLLLLKLPTIELVRNKKKKGTYFGPFLQKSPARKTFHFLMQTFNLKLCNKKIELGCLDYHIGNCAGNCKPNFDLTDYCFRITLAREALKNNQDGFIQNIKDQMKKYSTEFAFEKAQRLHEYLQNVDTIFNTLNTHFSADKFATDIFVASTPTSLLRQTKKTVSILNCKNFWALPSRCAPLTVLTFHIFKAVILLDHACDLLMGNQRKVCSVILKLKH